MTEGISFPVNPEKTNVIPEVLSGEIDKIREADVKPAHFFDSLDPQRWHQLMSEGKLTEYYRSVGLNEIQIQAVLTEKRERQAVLRESYDTASVVTLYHRNYIKETTFANAIGQTGIHTLSNVSLIDVLSVSPLTQQLVDLVKEFDEGVSFYAGDNEGFQKIANATGKRMITKTREECPSWYPRREFSPQIA